MERRCSRRRADRADGDPVRSGIRRGSEDPSRRQLRVTRRQHGDDRTRVRRKFRRRRGSNRRQDGRWPRRDEGRHRHGLNHAAQRPHRRRHRRRQCRRATSSTPKPIESIAGARPRDGKSLADVRKLLRSGALDRAATPRPAENTTIVVVATNAKMTKARDQPRRASWPTMASRGRSRRHTPSATAIRSSRWRPGSWSGTANPTIVGALAADAVTEAIVRAVSKARRSGGLPAARDLGTVPARIK